MSSPPTAPAGSPILEMARRAAEYRAAGRRIIDLTLGEPDFAPPVHAVAAAQRAAARPMGYTSASGTPELRRAARHALERDRALSYSDAEVAVGCGAKQVIFNAFFATLRPGDEVIIPAPYWASYPDMVRLCGAVPVIVPCPAESGFRLTPDALAAAVTERTRWIVLNAPGNPSGATYGHDLLAGLAEVLRRHPSTLILSDEIYAHIRYHAGEYVSIAQVAPDLRERILLVDGVSKAYAMTGWRVGWGFGAPDLIHRITAVQTHNCTQTSTVSQIAAVAALRGPQDLLAERRETYRRRRDAGLAILKQSRHLDTVEPDGAFYLFPRLAAGDDLAAADALLEAGCATVPGSAFGAPGHLRLSFATDIAALEEGCRIIVATLDGISA
ncbi:aminotransferase class I/II-fold pyridoxal phosphate-dependent enzyme [Streptomyces scabiei]|uniref:aminotransferase class I/II-fold pyridoxal phosphate-dependent enzyme n=1 Tax=Streptomyces scabiei TaxID=1930 RepID=UPI0018FE5FE2|nr:MULTISPECIES: aminotransferase class I/II-fold pyridoxal phosphate-dependent enzyme [Streptomyces]MDX2535740.1 aminotransferase class I/II-fold pyridoxal phosphate-dependent enzyme [Streptomyces scabiei]MDX2796999.1 aminotransferase class I/II-fold pyridoxal phosphate-dependent enzyme [Streptomyces scabiei]MDX2856482.1 aminotransferase class I/II-fold pyridoxal phosphate-dependent enzyme [Streptomyces scabiei]MDX3825753.1 aminotransferase class I/II-fold pyridoxal phosphate-dependent enzyme 